MFINRICLRSAIAALMLGVTLSSLADGLRAGEILTIKPPSYVRTNLRTAAKRLDPYHDVRRAIYVGERLGCGPGGAITYKEWGKIKTVAGGGAGIQWSLVNPSSRNHYNVIGGRTAAIEPFQQSISIAPAQAVVVGIHKHYYAATTKSGKAAYAAKAGKMGHKLEATGRAERREYQGGKSGRD